VSWYGIIIKYLIFHIAQIFQCGKIGTYGYVISVVSVEDEDVEAGLIDIDTGAVNISVYYTVILLRPFKNEVLDAIGDTSRLQLLFSVMI
jgi:DNA-directed RNA polymerase subunit E'/Rpb7